MKTWNFGIIGAGLIAGFHAKAIADIPNAKLIGVCGKSQGKAEKLAGQYNCKAYGDYHDLLADGELDIVTIATPSGLHAEPVIAAAEAGKHAICEKPLEISLDRIDAMAEAHNKAGTVLGGIFQYRFNEAVKILKEAIDTGRFGKITFAGAYVPWWRAPEYYKDSWHGTLKLDGGGALMNQSIHAIDLLCYLMPPVENVAAFTDNICHTQIETEDTAVAILRFQNNALGSIYGTTASWPGQLKRIEITGTKGTVVYLEDSFVVWQFDQEQPGDAQIRERFSKAQSKGGSADPSDIPYTNHKLNIQAFIDALDGKQTFELTATEARKSVELILAIYQSAKAQKLIQISTVPL